VRLALALLLVPALAAADSAEQLFGEGRALLQQGKAAEACTKFEIALALDPTAPGVLLNLGLCNENQHKIASALKWFRKAQTLAAEHGMTEVEDAAKQKAIALAAQVPTVRIDVPAGVSVELDGAPVDPTSLGRLELDAGHHVVELHGKDVYDQPQPVEIADTARDQRLALQLALPAPPPPRSHRRRTAWILGGIGVGLLATDLALGLYGRHEFDSSHDLATRQHWKDVVSYGGAATFAAGAIALGTAGYLYFTAAPDQVGVTVAGRF